jgi:hypothetical protein
MTSKENGRLIPRFAVRSAVLAAFVAACALSAGASPISMQVVSLDWSKGGSLQMLVDGHLESEYAGAINIRLDGVNYQAMCVDLFTSIGYETIAVNPYSPYSVNNAARAAWLFATQFGSVHTAVAAEALQLAIWDVIHDGGDGLGAGRIRASTRIGTPLAVVTAANQYLTMSVGQTSGEASVYISIYGADAKQSLMSNYLGFGSWSPPVDQGSPAPEPGSLGLGALGSACLIAGLYWKRRRRARARYAG